MNRRKSERQTKLRWKLHPNSVSVLIAASTIGIVVLMLFFIYGILSHALDDSAVQVSVQSNEQAVGSIARSIDSYMDEMLSIAGKTEQIFRQRNGRKEIGYVDFVVREDIDTIAVFDEDGDLLMKSDSRPLKEQVDIPKEPWFETACRMKEDAWFTEPHVQRFYRGHYPWVISMIKRIDLGVKDGFILVDMNFRSIQELCTPRDRTSGDIYILDGEGEVIFHPDQQMLYAGIQDESIAYAADMEDGTQIVDYTGGRYIISCSRLETSDWYVVEVNRMKWFDDMMENIRIAVGRMGPLILALVIGMAILSAWVITKPLKRLARMMEEVAEGHLAVQIEEKGYYEAVGLARTFNRMTNQIRQLLEEVKREHESLRKSEMKTLHEQINSHFLYNTLDSVIWMLEVRDWENSIKMLKALSRFFRLSLSRGREIIPVGDELSHVENYLIIQKMRYGENFEYDIYAEDGIKNARTLKMVLQPIVENAITHGMQGRESGGVLRIFARAEEGKLLFTVWDNGHGIEPGKLEHILEVDASNKSGVGIKNVNERIRLMFGAEYGLHLDSKQEEWTKVEICLPLICDERRME